MPFSCRAQSLLPQGFLPDIEVCAVELPGHGRRFTEPLIDRLDTLIDRLVQILSDKLDRISQSWIDFHDVACQHLDEERFEIVLLRSVEGFAEAGTRIEGRYLLTADHVITAVSLSAQAQDASEERRAFSRIEGR